MFSSFITGRLRIMLVLLVVAGFSGVPAQTAHAAAVPSTFVAMVSEPGDYVGDESVRLYRPTNAEITIRGTAKQVTVVVQGPTPGNDFTFVFDAPRGGHLEPGTYESARDEFGDAVAAPGLEVWGEGRQCNDSPGRFRVLEIAADPAGAVDSFDAIYEFRCDNRESVYGQVRVNAGASDADLLVASQQIDFPARDVGDGSRATPVWLVNTSAEPTVVESASIAGAPAFSVFHDPCTGEQISPGGQCALYLRFAPESLGPLTGSLQVTTSTSQATYEVALSGTGGTVPLDATTAKIARVERAGADAALVTFSEHVHCPGAPLSGEFTAHYVEVDPTAVAYRPIINPDSWSCPSQTELLLQFPAGTIREGRDGLVRYNGSGWLRDLAGNDVPASMSNLIDTTGHPPAGTLLYASTADGRIVSFDSGDAAHPLTSVRLQTATGEAVTVGQIDFRAKDGLLYGVSDYGLHAGQWALVTIDVETGLVTPVADTQSTYYDGIQKFDMRGDHDVLLGNSYTRLDYRSPDSGKVVETSENVVDEDAPEGDWVRIGALASSAPDNDPATVGRLYAHDPDRHQLMEIVGTPTQPLARPIGPMGDLRVLGFDIGLDGEAWAVFTNRWDGPARFAKLDLATGSLSDSDMVANHEIHDIALPLPKPTEDLDAPAIRSAAYSATVAGNDVVEVVFDEPVACTAEDPTVFSLTVQSDGRTWASEDAIAMDCARAADRSVAVTFPGELFFAGGFRYTLTYAPVAEGPVTDLAGHPAVAMPTEMFKVGNRAREPFIDVLDGTIVEGQPSHVEVELSRGAWPGTEIRLGDFPYAPGWQERGEGKVQIPEGGTTGSIPVTFNDDRRVEPTTTTIGWVDPLKWFGTRRRDATVTVLDDDADRPQMTSARVVSSGPDAMRLQVTYDEPVDCLRNPANHEVVLDVPDGFAHHRLTNDLQPVEVASCDGDEDVVLVYAAYTLARDEAVTLRLPGADIDDTTFVQDADGLAAVGWDEVVVDTSEAADPPPYISLADATFAEPQPGEECVDMPVALEGAFAERSWHLQYQTTSETATAPRDFLAGYWRPATTTAYGPDNPEGRPAQHRKFPLCLAGDEASEPTETFLVQIRMWGTELDDTARVTLLDDDLPTLQLLRSATTITVGEPAELRASLTGPNGAGFSSQPVVIERYRPASSSWDVVRRGTTGEAGDVTATVSPTSSGQYRVRYSGHAHMNEVVSEPVTVRVQPTISAAFNRTTVEAGRAVALRGRTGPAHRDYEVKVQRRNGDRWRSVGSAVTDDEGRYRFSVSHSRRGTWSYRTVLPAHEDHAAARSSAVRLKVTS